MMRKRVLLSWSGGKDSALALQALRADPNIEVAGLLTSVTRDYERISVHGVRRSLLERQAERLRLPLFTIELDPVTTNDAYESAFLSALERVQRDLPGVTAIAFGDLFLADVRVYCERLLDELPSTVDPCGERGEFHTFVSDGPGYEGPVEYAVGDTVLRDERFAYCDLVPPEESGATQ